MRVEPPFLLLQHKTILDSQANTPVVLYLDPLLDEAVMDFLLRHLTPETAFGYGDTFRKFRTFLCAATG